MQDDNQNLEVRNRLPMMLCKELVLLMLTMATHVTEPWVLSLFEGVGSFSHTSPTYQNVKYVRVSHSFSKAAPTGPNIYNVDMVLDENTTMGLLLGTVWHATGLTPDNCIGITASPPCTTVTKMDVSPNNQHLDHENSHMPRSDLAHKHARMFANFFRLLFGDGQAATPAHAP